MKQAYGIWVAAVVATALCACGESDGQAGATGTAGTPAPGVGSGAGGNPSMASTAAGGIPGPATMAPPGTQAPGQDTSVAGGVMTMVPVGSTGATAGDAGGAAAGTAGATPAGDMTAVGGATDDPAQVAGGASPAASCGPENQYSAAELGDADNLGPWTPTHVERTGPDGSSWIYHPEELGKDGVKHPVFQWGPGAGTGPSQYLDHLNLIASQGFVVISQASTMSGKAALDWILEENDKEGSMWYQKLDPERVGRGGHSMGALQSFSEADDPRIKLYVLVCGGANGGSGAANIDDPAIFLGGRGESGTTNFRGDYAETQGLTAFVTHSDTDHIYCARDNLAPWVAFMRWHFCGEEQWKAEFMPDGTYCRSPWDECQTKHFE